MEKSREIKSWGMENSRCMEKGGNKLSDAKELVLNVGIKALLFINCYLNLKDQSSGLNP